MVVVRRNAVASVAIKVEAGAIERCAGCLDRSARGFGQCGRTRLVNRDPGETSGEATDRGHRLLAAARVRRDVLAVPVCCIDSDLRERDAINQIETLSNRRLDLLPMFII